MKKLESLNGKKFEDFKNNELQNMHRIVAGGATCVGNRCDVQNNATSDGTHTNGAGQGIDFKYVDCE